MAGKKTPEFECLECGEKYYTVRAAKKAINGGCSKCGGVDIDVYVPKTKNDEGTVRQAYDGNGDS